VSQGCLYSKIFLSILNPLSLLKKTKKRKDPDLFEFKFSYLQVGVSQLSEKYFFAENLTMASEMFTFACSKENLKIESMEVKRWNRWADRWEDVN